MLDYPLNPESLLPEVPGRSESLVPSRSHHPVDERLSVVAGRRTRGEGESTLPGGQYVPVVRVPRGGDLSESGWVRGRSPGTGVRVVYRGTGGRRPPETKETVDLVDANSVRGVSVPGETPKNLCETTRHNYGPWFVLPFRGLQEKFTDTDVAGGSTVITSSHLPGTT